MIELTDVNAGIFACVSLGSMMEVRVIVQHTWREVTDEGLVTYVVAGFYESLDGSEREDFEFVVWMGDDGELTGGLSIGEA